MLLTEDRSVQHLQDKTLGMSGVVSASDPELLIATLKEGLVSDIQDESKKEIDKIKKVSSAKIKTAQRDRNLAQEQASTFEEQIKNLSQEDQVIVKNTVKRAKQFGRRCKRGIKIFAAFLIFLVGVYLWLGPNLEQGPLRDSLSLIFSVILPVLLLTLQVFDRPFGLNNLSEKLMRRKFDKIIHNNALHSKFDDFNVTFKGMDIYLTEKEMMQNPNIK